MLFITCNQYTCLVLFAKQTTLTPFAMHSIVGKVMQCWYRPCYISHVVINDVIFRTTKCMLILIVFQNSILVSYIYSTKELKGTKE